MVLLIIHQVLTQQIQGYLIMNIDQMGRRFLWGMERVLLLGVHSQ